MSSWVDVEVKNSTDTSVKKYIFTKEDAVAESVLYAYPTYQERAVMCVSCQTGCPMGCSFCGTGKFFGRNLSADEILEQIEHMRSENNIDFAKCAKLQLMFMSMGEPLLNMEAMEDVIWYLRDWYPNAQLLVSTSGPKTEEGWDDFMRIASQTSTLGLQFSVHESSDEARDKLIPMKKKLCLEEIAHMGLEFYRLTGRKPFFNYCVHKGNSTDEDVMRLRMLFDPRVWECTLSVICEADETNAQAHNKHLDLIADFNGRMVQVGFNTRIFDPAGQDDCGGGCGQLWQVQKFAMENPHIMQQSPGDKIRCRNVG